MSSAGIAVVGAGICGTTAAAALRAQGYEGRVVVYGDEPHPPYDRPPLSKEFMLGGEPVWLPLARRAEEMDVALRPATRVVALHPSSRMVETAGGRQEQFDSVLLATGGRPRRIALDGTAPVHYLRTLDDATSLRAQLQRGGHIVVVGAGFIGGEMASAARALGCSVTLVEILPEPFARVLGPLLGGYLADLHAHNGVEVRSGIGVARVHGDANGLEAVTLSDGSVLEAHAVVVGVGMVPNVELAEAAGLTVDDGVVVDDALRTSNPWIHAAGDVAARPPGEPHLPRRLEHWRSALDQGTAAARALLTGEAAVEPVPWFWTDQHGVNIQMAGHPDPGADVVVRGCVEAGDATVFWVRDSLIAAAVGINRGAEVRATMKLMANRTSVRGIALHDDATPLRELLGERPRRTLRHNGSA